MTQIVRRYTAARQYVACPCCGEDLSSTGNCTACDYDYWDAPDLLFDEPLAVGRIDTNVETHGGRQLMISAERGYDGGWVPVAACPNQGPGQ